MARETLAPRARRRLMSAAIVLGFVGAAVAAYRRDWTGGIVILVALAALLAVWYSTRDVDGDDDRENDDRA